MMNGAPSETKTARIGFISRLRAVSCIAIIVLHAFFVPINLFQPEPALRLVPMIVRNCMLWAVPCFVMVSGALLLDPARQITIKDVFTKYIKRALIALLVFSLIFVIFDAVVDGKVQGFAIVTDWLYKVFTGRSWLHMWYLYMLIGLYLMLPLYRAVTAKADKSLLRYGVIIFFIFLSIVPTLNNAAGVNTGFYILASTVYPFYFFLGYALFTDTIKIGRAAGWIMFILGTAAVIAVTYFGQVKDIEALKSMGNSYAFTAVAIQAAGVFTLFKTSKDRDNAFTRCLNAIDRCSFGMYLLHVLVLYTIYRVFKADPFKWGGIPLMAGAAVITAVVSYLITFILRKMRIKL